MGHWRATIGIIAASTGIALERDFHTYAPDGVGVVTTRVPLKGPAPEHLEESTALLAGVASVFRGTGIDIITYGCTAGSMIGGFDFDQECIRRIRQGAGDVPVQTTGTLVKEAFAKLNARNIAIVTPYPDKTNEAEKQFFEHAGFNVVNIAGINPDNHRVDKIPAQFIYKAVKKVDLKGADALLISCSGLDIVPLLDSFEGDLNLPVISSNQITFWGSLRHAGILDRISGIGSLLTV